MSTLRTIDIVGGGLAGLSLGIGLRREGVPVTIHEAGSYPRHRVCGEFIAGLSEATITRLELAPALRGALRHHEVAWCFGEGPPQIKRLPSPALGISRHTLDARLADLFVSSGGVLHSDTRITETPSRAGWVSASGRRRAAEPRWIGLKLHVRHLPLRRELEMHPGIDAYVGLAKVEDDTVNVCGLFQRRTSTGRGPELLDYYLRAAGLAALAERLAAATPDPDSFCAVAALGFDRRVAATGSRIRIGDAGAMIPPFTGNGMAMAFQGAELVLSPLLDYSRGATDWATTCRIVQAAFWRRFRLRLASAGALHPFLLNRGRQRWFAALSRARLLPFGPLYAALH